MAVITTEPPSTPTRTPVAQQLSTLDRYLPVWILAAMVVGLLLGRVVPGIGTALAAVEVDGVSLPISIGLLVMMYPVLAKVRYDRLGTVTHDRRMLVSRLLLNWVVGPLVMFTLAWTFLADLPTYRTGLIIVGLARCIAMVIIWNDLACGDREAAAVLVAINSIFQVVAFAALGWFYLSALPSWLGLEQTSLNVSAWQIAKSVLIFLGIPLVAGYLTRTLGENAWGRETYEHSFLPKIGPWALYGLLFTIVVLFALQGEQITSRPLDVVRIALPLLVYFAVMWGIGHLLGRSLHLGYERTTTLAFTAAGKKYTDQLEDLDKWASDSMSAVPEQDRVLFSSHDAFGYFSNEYGVKFIGSALSDFNHQQDATSSHIDEQVKKVRESGAKAIFAENSNNSKSIEAIARAAGVKAVTSDDALYGDSLGVPGSEGETYIGSIVHNINTLVSAWDSKQQPLPESLQEFDFAKRK